MYFPKRTINHVKSTLLRWHQSSNRQPEKQLQTCTDAGKGERKEADEQGTIHHDDEIESVKAIDPNEYIAAVQDPRISPTR